MSELDEDSSLDAETENEENDFVIHNNSNQNNDIDGSWNSKPSNTHISADHTSIEPSRVGRNDKLFLYLFVVQKEEINYNSNACHEDFDLYMFIKAVNDKNKLISVMQIAESNQTGLMRGQ